MNKKGREENFAFGTTDQSNSQRKPPLMRVVQEKKDGRKGTSESEEKSMAHHSYTEKKDESYTASSGRHSCVCLGGWVAA